MLYVRRWSRAAMLVLLLLASSACQRSDAGVVGPEPSATIGVQDSPLAGTSWELVRYGTPLSSTAPLSSTQPIFTFDDPVGNLSGSAGCNSMFGTYAVTGTLLTIWRFGQTAMACGDNAVMAQEAYILENLPKAGTWTIVSDTLTLSDATHTFRFIRRRNQ
jgi:heat shock protein HslJ